MNSVVDTKINDTITLQPDDNGIIVVMKDVPNEDTSFLKAFRYDPTDSHVSKYYDYNQNIGFFINKTYFDHAEYRGTRLNYDEYLAQMNAKNNDDDDAIYATDAIDATKQIEDNDSINAIKACIDKIIAKALASKKPEEIIEYVRQLIQIMKDDESSSDSTLNDAIKYEIDENTKVNNKMKEINEKYPNASLRRYISWHAKQIKSLSDKLSIPNKE